MTKIQSGFNRAVMAYIKHFETVYEIDFEGWVGDAVGEVATFGDYFYDFQTIKYAVDNEITWGYLIGWYYYSTENYKDNFVNLDSYCRLRRDNEPINDENFETVLIQMRKKNNLNDELNHRY